MLDTLKYFQNLLEDFYGAKTNLNVCDFVKFVENPSKLASMQVLQHNERRDIDLAILLDRDIFSASRPKSSMHWGIIAEELSHFIYLAFNHRRGRDITSFEMELQSEIDRVVLAREFSSVEKRVSTAPTEFNAHHALRTLLTSPYEEGSVYEKSRILAAKYMKTFSSGDMTHFSSQEKQKLCDFFHSDLPKKLHLVRNSKESSSSSDV